MKTSEVQVGTRGSLVTIAGDAGAVAWASSYLLPWWPDSAGIHRGLVVASIDIGRHQAALDRAHDETAHKVRVFNGATALRLSSPRDMAVSRTPEVAYERVSETRVDVFGPNKDWVAYGAALIARQIVRYSLEREGWLLYHAACELGPDGCNLIVGRKGAGKTTTAVRRSMQPSHALVANDRCLLIARDGGVEAAAWPMPVAIGLGLLEALGWTQRVVASVRAGDRQHYAQHERVTAALRAGTVAPLFDAAGKEHKYELYGQHLRDWFGVQLSSGGKIRAVLHPERVDDGNRAVVVPVRDGSRRLVFDELLSGDVRGYGNFLSLPCASRATLEQSFVDLVSATDALPNLQVRWTTDDSPAWLLADVE